MSLNFYNKYWLHLKNLMFKYVEEEHLHLF